MPTWLGTRAQRLRALLIALVMAIIWAVLREGAAALVPFFIGAILVYILIPPVQFLQDRAPRKIRGKRVARTLAIILVYLVVFGLLGGLLSYVVPELITQTQQLVSTVPKLAENLSGRISFDVDALLERIPLAIRSSVEEGVQTTIRAVGDALQTGIEKTVQTVWATVSFIVGMAIVPIWVFLVLSNLAGAQRTFNRMIPPAARGDVHNIVGIIDSLASAYLRGQLILCLVIAAASTILLAALGVPQALLLGTLAGAFEVIPNLGPFIGAIPAVVVTLLVDPIKAVWVALGFVVIQQVENAFLVPRISGRAVRFHPAIVIVLVLVGSEVAGLWGMLLAVPLAAMLRDVARYLYLRTTDRGATPEMAMEILRAQSV
ncbi:MAG: AI-2E family transporter [Chloroflexi bacterium]|nr:AI-2E family transporter [Chloroflexota bacterium]